MDQIQYHRCPSKIEILNTHIQPEGHHVKAGITRSVLPTTR